VLLLSAGVSRVERGHRELAHLEDKVLQRFLIFPMILNLKAFFSIYRYSVS
jgi:hypothetical protein